ncbi:variable surface protein, partial [Plasmodium gonderi]
MASIGPLSIDSIFPRCIKEYKDVERENSVYFINSFNNVCNKIIKELLHDNTDYKSVCIFLSNYLKHIQSKSAVDRIPYCKYFNF